MRLPLSLPLLPVLLLPLLAGCTAAAELPRPDGGWTSCGNGAVCEDSGPHDVLDAGPGRDTGDAVQGSSPDAGPPLPPADGGACSPATAANVCSAEGCAALPPTCSTACEPLAAVRFHLQVLTSDAGSYMATSYIWAADTVNWFTVTTAAGDPVQVMPPTADQGKGLSWSPSCSACAAMPIAPLASAQPLDDGGISGVWNGTSYSLTATCTDPTLGAIGCGDVLCAAAGSYVVKMCLSSPPNGAPATCVLVPFDFPGTPDVTGTITP